jgi:opacity protein-like surface antigen
MKNHITAILLASFSLTAISLPALAEDRQPKSNWVGGVSYINLSDGEDDFSTSLKSIVGSLGHKISSDNNFLLVPQITIGFGVGDDTLYIYGSKINVRLDHWIALSLRGQYQLDNGLYLFAAPSYANAQFTASSGGYSETDDEWEFGVGIGAGYNFSETASAELNYEQFNGTDVISLGIKFNF